MNREPIPRLPVFGWQALHGARAAALPCMLDLPGLHYSTSGRAAILLALEALGITHGDGVLLPTYHCPTMVAPAAGLHARPVFYPIDGRGTPDLAWLSRQDLRGVRVMLAAHYFGVPQPMGDVQRWCHERGIALIEDCAHALFGRSGERPIGAWGDIAIGSLTKFLPVPEGGCLIVNCDKARAQMPLLAACGSGTHLRAALDIVEVGATQGELGGLNGLITASLAGLRRLRGKAPASSPAQASANLESAGADFVIDATLAHRQPARPCRWVAQALPRGRIVERRRRNFELLQRRLSGHAGMHPLLPALAENCAPYVFPLWVERPDPGYAELRRLGMPVFRWDRLWPGVPALAGDQGRLWSHHVLQLACHQDLNDSQLERFVAALLRLYKAAPTAAAMPSTELSKTP